jgi:CGNR zinc finger
MGDDGRLGEAEREGFDEVESTMCITQIAIYRIPPERILLQFIVRSTFAARSPVRAALSAVAEDAIEAFSGERRQLTRCDDPQCSALLLSRSRGPRRRWCSMETCGNRAKVAAYRARRG